jgi:N-acetylmuramoyl-L-alanine amidase
MIKKTATLFLLYGITFGLQSFDELPRIQKPLLRTIVIDPGHGGFDPGTHGLFSKEKDVALNISLKLGKALQSAYPDLKIVYTRTTDIMAGNKTTIQEGIRYRAELANKLHGDLFICIHCNSDGQPPGQYPVRRLTGYKTTGKGKKKKKLPVYVTYWVKNDKTGTATYIWKADRSGPKGAAINQRNGENMGDSTNSAFDLTTPQAKMLALLYEKKYFANSALFGTLVEKEFAKSGRQSDGVKQRQIGIGVLQATGMPSVLIETGYLTNQQEELYLSSKRGQKQVVGCILNAFRQYKRTLESGRAETAG